MGQRRREAVIVKVTDDASVKEWERLASILLQCSCQMRGLQPRSRITYRLAHGHEAFLEAWCEVEKIAGVKQAKL